MDWEIFSRVKTKESAQILCDELEMLLKSLYRGSDEFGSVLKTKVRANLSEFIRNKLTEKDINIEAYLKDLLEKVKKVPTVRLIIAFEPSEDAIDRFYSFIVDACQRPVLLDIGYAPDIIGGAVIIYEGKYRDYSFKNIFEEEFEREQKNILELLEK